MIRSTHMYAQAHTHTPHTHQRHIPDTKQPGRHVDDDALQCPLIVKIHLLQIQGSMPQDTVTLRSLDQRDFKRFNKPHNIDVPAHRRHLGIPIRFERGRSEHAAFLGERMQKCMRMYDFLTSGSTA